MNARFRALRTLSAAVIAGAITMAVAAPSSGAAAATPRQFVSLQGEGSWSVTSALVPWQNDLASAGSFVNLNYVKHGSFLGRQDLISKNVDFAISGVPFTADELADVDGGAGGVHLRSDPGRDAGHVRRTSARRLPVDRDALRPGRSHARGRPMSLTEARSAS